MYTSLERLWLIGKEEWVNLEIYTDILQAWKWKGEAAERELHGITMMGGIGT